MLFIAESGEKTDEVAQSLKEQNLIRSKHAFTLFAKLRGLDKKIQHGRYRLNTNMNLAELLNAITDPEQTEIRVTIPEGFSVRDIDERLAEMGLIKAGEFAAAASSLEGYLFPDTYFVFNTNFDPENLIKKMQDNFLQKLTPDLLEAIKNSNRTLAEIITAASIVEKEVKTEKDHPVVAGILWKRLDNGWPLQADATLLYGKAAPIITQKELAEDNPYNTRKNKGLPPTPIGNPGLATIRAAIFPEKTRYWFYLTDKEGNVHYAVTNEQHNENRKKYLRNL